MASFHEFRGFDAPGTTRRVSYGWMRTENTASELPPNQTPAADGWRRALRRYSVGMKEMNIDKTEFDAALRKVDPEVTPLSGDRRSTFLAYLRVSGIPENLSTFLADSIPCKYIRFVSGGYIYEDDSIMDSNEEYKKMIESGFLQVGHAPNGDQIAIDFRHAGRSGYISHDEFYEEYEDVDLDVSSMFIPVADSIGKMVQSLVDDPEFPIDIFDAEEKGYANN